jgi:hypothetical protein
VSFTRALSEWWQIGHSKVRLLYSGLWASLLASIIIAPHFGQDGLLVAIEAGVANRNPSMYFSLNSGTTESPTPKALLRCDGCGRPMCFVSVIPRVTEPGSDCVLEYVKCETSCRKRRGFPSYRDVGVCTESDASYVMCSALMRENHDGFAGI